MSNDTISKEATCDRDVHATVLLKEGADVIRFSFTVFDWTREDDENDRLTDSAKAVIEADEPLVDDDGKEWNLDPEDVAGVAVTVGPPK